MQGIAKAVLISILVSVCILMFVNLVFFFPWYMTLITETFNLSQTAANDNYVKRSYYDDALDRLRSRPIFRDKAGDIVIAVKNDSGYNAVGYDDETVYERFAEFNKPYRQKGKPVTITIDAAYPLSISVWGRKIEREIPVSFSLTVVGLKHYKDLEFY